MHPHQLVSEQVDAQLRGGIQGEKFEIFLGGSPLLQEPPPLFLLQAPGASTPPPWHPCHLPVLPAPLLHLPGASCTFRVPLAPCAGPQAPAPPPMARAGPPGPPPAPGGPAPLWPPPVAPAPPWVHPRPPAELPRAPAGPRLPRGLRRPCAPRAGLGRAPSPPAVPPRGPQHPTANGDAPPDPEITTQKKKFDAREDFRHIFFEILSMVHLFFSFLKFLDFRKLKNFFKRNILRNIPFLIKDLL